MATVEHEARCESADAFGEWMSRVDDVIADRADGMKSADLPDCDWWNWWNDGVAVTAAADMALNNAGWGQW